MGNLCVSQWEGSFHSCRFFLCRGAIPCMYALRFYLDVEQSQEE
jgi:hypothetical protein